MSLLEKIFDAAVDSSQPITPALRRVVLLGDRLNNEMLRSWADRELNGYPDDVAVPPYRTGYEFDIWDVEVYGNGIYYGEKPVWRKPYEFRDSISSLEKRINAVEGRLFGAALTDKEVRNLIPTKARERTFHWTIDRHVLITVVEGVRSRLFEFILKLEKEAPEAGEVDSSELPISQERVSQIFLATIYTGAIKVDDHSVHVSGKAGHVVGGEGNEVRQGDIVNVSDRRQLIVLLDQLQHAVQSLPSEQVEVGRELVEAVREEALAEKPRPKRITHLLKSLTAVATTTGLAGAAVIDAVQAILRAIDG